MRTGGQLERLNLEHQILHRDGLTQFNVYRDSAMNTYFVWGDHRTNAGNTYTLWIPIPRWYPDERPPLYIHRPNPLWGYRTDRTINSYGLLHAMHTLENGPNREVQICHWRNDRWHRAITLNKVLIKGILWLEAFEQHRVTGESINSFVRTMQPL